MSVQSALWSALGVISAIASAVPGHAASNAPPVDILKTTRPSNVIVLAHRACWAKAPENSLAAIEACKTLGADVVEIDVRRSRDGRLFIMHDETVDRTTDGKGAIANLTAAQIGSLRLRMSAGGPDAALTDQHIPSAEEALNAARGKLVVNLHLKAPVEAEVAALVKRMNMTGQVTTWVVAKPNDPQLLQSPLMGTIGLIPTLSECGPQYPEPCWTLPLGSLEPYARVRPAAFFVDFRQSHTFIQAVSQAKRPAGSRIFTETLGRVDDLPQASRRAEWRALLDMGVSVIMTNEPGDLIDFLKAADVGAAASPALAGTPKRPLVVAHRGGAALMPENTFPAFDNAVRLGADLLEFDIEMTADDQIVVQHDGTVNPAFCTADPGSGLTAKPVRSLTLAQLKRFDCGSKHRDIYPRQVAVPGERMPTPAGLFARYKGKKVVFYGEAKMPGPGEGDVDPVLFARKIEAAIHQYGVEDRFILQSSDYRTIDAMHAINPQIRTCLLRPWEAKTDFLELARKHHATCMLLRLQDADAAEVKRLRDAGVMVVSEVIDDETNWRNYLARGDDALFTNDPAGLIAFLKAQSTGQAIPH